MHTDLRIVFEGNNYFVIDLKTGEKIQEWYPYDGEIKINSYSTKKLFKQRIDKIAVPHGITPPFVINDWVTNGVSIYKITKINGAWANAVDKKGNPASIKLDVFKKYSYPWEIGDWIKEKNDIIEIKYKIVKINNNYVDCIYYFFKKIEKRCLSKDNIIKCDAPIIQFPVTIDIPINMIEALESSIKKHKFNRDMVILQPECLKRIPLGASTCGLCVYGNSQVNDFFFPASTPCHKGFNCPLIGNVQICCKEYFDAFTARKMDEADNFIIATNKLIKRMKDALMKETYSNCGIKVKEFSAALKTLKQNLVKEDDWVKWGHDIIKITNLNFPVDGFAQGVDENGKFYTDIKLRQCTKINAPFAVGDWLEHDGIKWRIVKLYNYTWADIFNYEQDREIHVKLSLWERCLAPFMSNAEIVARLRNVNYPFNNSVSIILTIESWERKIKILQKYPELLSDLVLSIKNCPLCVYGQSLVSGNAAPCLIGFNCPLKSINYGLVCSKFFRAAEKAFLENDVEKFIFHSHQLIEELKDAK